MYRILGFVISVALMLLGEAAAVASAQAGGATTTQQIVAAVPATFPPFFQLDGRGQPSGYAIDAMAEIAHRANLDIVYKVYDTWGEAIDAVAEGRADIIPAIAMTAERESRLAFTQPYVDIAISSFIKVGRTLSARLKPAGSGSVAVVADTVGNDPLSLPPRARAVSYLTFEQALLDLLRGKVDTLIHPEPVAWKLALDAGVAEMIRTSGDPLYTEQWGVAVAKSNRPLLAIMERGVSAFINSPRRAGVFNAWFAEQPRFWTQERLIFLSLAAIVLISVAMAIWRHMTVVAFNRRLSISEERYRTLIEGARDAILVCDARTGLIEDANRKAQDLFGKPGQGLAGVPLEKLLPEHGRSPALSESIWADGASGIEEEITTADGRRIPVEINATIADFQGKKMLFGIFRDISLRRQAQESLRQSEALLTAMIDNSPAKIHFKDRAGRYQLINRKAQSLFGMEPQRVIGKTTEQVFPLDMAVRFMEHDRRVFETGVPSTMEEVFYDNGHERIFQTVKFPIIAADGTIMGTGAIGTDITDQKASERAIIESREGERLANERLTAALEAIDEGFAIYDADDRIVMCNSKYKACYPGAIKAIEAGKTFEEVLRESVAAGELAEAVGNEDEWIARRLAQHRTSGAPVEQKLSNGRWLRIAEKPTKDGGTVGFRIDITELKRAHEELRAAHDDLERRVSERTRELELAKEAAEQASQVKSRFLAAASHDLRQPLQALALFVGAFEDRVKSSKDRALVEKMRSAMDAMDGLLLSLLDISRLEAGLIRPEHVTVPLDDLFRRLRDEFQPLGESKGLDVRYVSTSAAVETDPSLFETILRNLLHNAVKYTEHGKIVFGCRHRRNIIRVEVHDGGVGIAEDKLPLIFQEFYQIGNESRRREKGLGLGLSIVSQLATLLGAKIEVRSELGRGSVFAVELPVSPETMNVADRPEKGPEQSPKPARIVIIDDEPSIIEAMTAYLEGWDHEVLAATDSHDEDFLKQLEAIGNDGPDLIIADYRLGGGKTGPAAIVELRRIIGRNTPAILLTGDTAADRLREAEESGFPLLHKPIRPEKLRNAIDRVLHRGDDPFN
ncbi:MAG: PAS domain S-box protein [Rhodospirillales bacterium]|nr:PAS domain S-box protein [Rhodospirillales bacterium]MCW8861378.1 PAS domain S-box protein [Rhodospirillales bacterium]MCW9001253.1 PAS domain S-box protein [Rhodospirillales bacterium]